LMGIGDRLVSMVDAELGEFMWPYHLTVEVKDPTRCWWCGALTRLLHPNGRHFALTRTRDHIYPQRLRVRGQKDNYNTVTACARCNNTRDNRSVWEWDEWLMSERGQLYFKYYDHFSYRQINLSRQSEFNRALVRAKRQRDGYMQRGHE